MGLVMAKVRKRHRPAKRREAVKRDERIEATPETRFDRAHFANFGAHSLDFEIVYFVKSPEYIDYRDRHQAISLAIHQDCALTNLSAGGGAAGTFEPLAVLPPSADALAERRLEREAWQAVNTLSHYVGSNAHSAVPRQMRDRFRGRRRPRPSPGEGAQGPRRHQQQLRLRRHQRQPGDEGGLSGPR